jgi:hypothetical protein
LGLEGAVPVNIALAEPDIAVFGECRTVRARRKSTRCYSGETESQLTADYNEVFTGIDPFRNGLGLGSSRLYPIAFSDIPTVGWPFWLWFGFWRLDAERR